MPDEEFDSFIHNYVMNNRKSGEDLSEMLKPLGIEFSQKSEKEQNKKESISGEMDSSNFTLTAYSSKRSGESFYRLGASWDQFGYETKPGTYDLVSIEWDPSVGAYYSASVGDTSKASKRDGTNRLKGVYLFNVYDNNIDFETYVTVYVTPAKSGTLEYGTKYSHTYTTLSTTTSTSASFSWSSTGVTGGLTYTVNTSETDKAWDQFDDNAVTLVK